MGNPGKWAMNMKMGGVIIHSKEFEYRTTTAMLTAVSLTFVLRTWYLIIGDDNIATMLIVIAIALVMHSRHIENVFSYPIEATYRRVLNTTNHIAWKYICTTTPNLDSARPCGSIG